MTDIINPVERLQSLIYNLSLFPSILLNIHACVIRPLPLYLIYPYPKQAMSWTTILQESQILMMTYYRSQMKL